MMVVVVIEIFPTGDWKYFPTPSTRPETGSSERRPVGKYFQSPVGNISITTTTIISNNAFKSRIKIGKYVTITQQDDYLPDIFYYFNPDQKSIIFLL
jgi:hypothetical protein